MALINLGTLNTFTTEKALPALLILIAGYFLKITLSKGIDKVMTKTESAKKLGLVREENRARTVGFMVQNLVTAVVVFITISAALSKVGVDIAPLIASAGILGLAVGFGSQALVKDIVTGFFILSENQYNLGDEVEIAGVKGFVREIKLRTTTLSEENGTVHIVPNSAITRVSKFPKKKAAGNATKANPS